MSTASRAREFDYTPSDFQWVQATAKATFGVQIVEDKRELVYSRLAPLLRKRGLSFDSLKQEMARGEDDLRQAFIDALTTNVTSFFREEHHFDLLAEHAERWGHGPARLWSAGCSLGMETYSAAITLLERCPNLDFRILGTDIDSQAVSTARAGVYDESAIEPVPRSWARRHFARGTGDNQGKVRVLAATRSKAVINPLNLMGDWPFKNRFHAIFCRNVLIYFDVKEKQELVQRFVDQLLPGGILFLGHSEKSSNASLRPIGRTAYLKEHST